MLTSDRRWAHGSCTYPAHFIDWTATNSVNQSSSAQQWKDFSSGSVLHFQMNFQLCFCVLIICAGQQKNCWWPSLLASSSSEWVRAGLDSPSHTGACLQDENEGFISRLLPLRWPCSLSSVALRAVERCRHFMIDALEDGHYVIAGESRRHRFLQDLVDFHRRAPIIPFNEVLTVACGQVT